MDEVNTCTILLYMQFPFRQGDLFPTWCKKGTQRTQPIHPSYSRQDPHQGDRQESQNLWIGFQPVVCDSSHMLEAMPLW